MAAYVAKRENHLEKIAQIMSENSGLKVEAKDVRIDVCTVTTSIYSTVVCDKVDGIAMNAKSIICKERKGERKNQGYEVTAENL